MAFLCKYYTNLIIIFFTKVFDGNWDQNTVVINSVNPEIVAQFVKIHPKTWHGHISMRAEFWGCEGGKATLVLFFYSKQILIRQDTFLRNER